MRHSHVLTITLLPALCLIGCGAPMTPSDGPLAVFEMGVNTVEFGVDGEGGITLSEQTPAGPDEHFVVGYEEGKSPLDWYLELTPDDLPVPYSLIEYHEAEGVTPVALDRREITAQLEAPVVLEPARVVADSDDAIHTKVSAINTPATGSCGSNGGSHFQGRYCGRSGNGQIERCAATYNGGNTVWYSHNGNTGSSTRKNTLTVTAACGVAAHGVLEYQGLGGSNWYNGTSISIPEDYVKSQTHYGTIKRHRRVRTFRNEEHNGFRTVAAFADQIMLVIPE